MSTPSVTVLVFTQPEVTWSAVSPVITVFRLSPEIASLEICPPVFRLLVSIFLNVPAKSTFILEVKETLLKFKSVCGSFEMTVIFPPASSHLSTLLKAWLPTKYFGPVSNCTTSTEFRLESEKYTASKDVDVGYSKLTLSVPSPPSTLATLASDR